MSVTRVNVSSEDAATEAAAPTETTTTTETAAPTGEQATTETTTTTQTSTETATAETTPVTGTQTSDADLDTAATEFLSTGEITEATLKALEAKGFNKAQATTYAKGIQAQADAATAKLAERVGGKDNLTSMLTWAKQGGLSAAEAAAYDSMMTSGNEAQMAFALDGLAARHEKALGSTHGRINAASAPAAAPPKAFTSNAEIVEAMSNPKYAKDPAYRAVVAARLAESNTISIRY